MGRFRVIITVLLLLAASIAAAGLFTYNRPFKGDIPSFSVARAIEDIRVISRKPHSVEHQLERIAVRDYLSSRIEEIGGNPEVFEYDSISNLYCRFDPEGGKTGPYLLLTAHYDSRFAQAVLGDTVYSYGAADDGYGLAVNLELLRSALSYRNEWKHGLKILFTDSEERDLDGMRCALARNPELFDNVGLVINVEARGVKGPALLFETSPGNSKLLSFYCNHAVHPYTYSITGAVYRLMPNFTDFTLLKDKYPGFNFAVIDDLNHYHTDRDNFSNISPKSLRHYGEQLAPMVREYLTSDSYPAGFFSASSDAVAFTLPGLGTVLAGRDLSLLLFSAAFAMYCMLLCLAVVKGGASVSGMFRQALYVLAASVMLLCAGEAVAFVSARIAGTPFRFVSTNYIKGDWLVTILSLTVMCIAYLAVFLRKRPETGRVAEHILGTMLCLLAFSVPMEIFCGESFFLSAPVGIAALSLVFGRLRYLGFLPMVAAALIVTAFAPFVFNLYKALTIGSLGIVLFISFYYIVLIATLVWHFLTDRQYGKLRQRKI